MAIIDVQRGVKVNSIKQWRFRIKIECLQGLGDSLVVLVIAAQAWEPEFKSPNVCVKLGNACDCVYSPLDHSWPSRPPSRFNVKLYSKKLWQKVIEQNTLSFAYALFCMNILHAQILHTLTNPQRTRSHPCDQFSPPGQCLFTLKL